jgi:hypothetical protein
VVPFKFQVDWLTSRALCRAPKVKLTSSPAVIVIVAGEKVNPEFVIVQVVEKPAVMVAQNRMENKNFFILSGLNFYLSEFY